MRSSKYKQNVNVLLLTSAATKEVDTAAGFCEVIRLASDNQISKHIHMVMFWSKCCYLSNGFTHPITADGPRAKSLNGIRAPCEFTPVMKGRTNSNDSVVRATSFLWYTSANEHVNHLQGLTNQSVLVSQG